MLILGDKGQVEACFSLFGNSARFALNVPQSWKLIWAHSMVLLGDVGQVDACFDPFIDIVNIDVR
jgi:hypothetical protein